MPLSSRRRFLQATILGSLGFPAILRAATSPKNRLPIAFSTLGCPKWDWNTVLNNAAKWGYSAIELRGVQGNLDLPKCPEFSAGRLTASKKDLSALDLKISDLGASTNLHEPDQAKRAKGMEDAKRFIDLAHSLDAPYIRVFGNKFVPWESREATITRVGEGLRSLASHAEGSGVTVILESHGDFVDSPTLEKVFAISNHPQAALLWDVHHTVVYGKESPQTTFRRLGKLVRHTHLKDSRPNGKDVKYVKTGEGTVPVKEAVQLLKKHGYTGYYCFEWEKLWHPEIADPEETFPHFAEVMREYLA